MSSILSSWPKHKYSSPLQVMRTRLQLSQKLWLCGEINPIFVLVFVTRQYRAGPPVVSVLAMSEYSLWSILRVSSLLQNVDSLAWLTSPRGISSINEISIASSIANFTNESASSSLMPRMSTVFNLMLSKPASLAACMPRKTLSNSPVRVIFLKRSAFKLSTLMLIRFTPAFFKSCACFSSWLPLVVSTNSCRPSSFPTCSKSHKAFLRTSGSPPVMRTLLTPRLTKMLISRAHSSRLRTSLRGKNVISSDMQYTQRKSQRSVMDRRI